VGCWVRRRRRPRCCPRCPPAQAPRRSARLPARAPSRTRARARGRSWRSTPTAARGRAACGSARERPGVGSGRVVSRAFKHACMHVPPRARVRERVRTGNTILPRVTTFGEQAAAATDSEQSPPGAQQRMFARAARAWADGGVCATECARVRPERVHLELVVRRLGNLGRSRAVGFGGVDGRLDMLPEVLEEIGHGDRLASNAARRRSPQGRRGKRPAVYCNTSKSPQFFLCDRPDALLEVKYESLASTYSSTYCNMHTSAESASGRH
jgi:hypothetical protein